MGPRRPSLREWIEWQLMPFVEDHPIRWTLLVYGVLFGGGALVAFITEGPGALVSRFGAVLAAFWWIGLLFLAWWAGDLDIRYHRARIERLRQNQLCIHCGYDLRATIDRCPECGNPIDARKPFL